ncbi:MAG: hypothetical protein IBJ18_09715 [Phycisphaerales bacterium]|nr:hypothetical protein [Phycisphaerales bacterium]
MLMVAFLIGDAIRPGAGGPRGEGIEVDGKKIDGETMAISGARFQMLADTVKQVKQIFALDDRATSDHWFLLAEAARRAGLVAPEGDGRTFFVDEYPTIMLQLYMQEAQRAGQQVTEESMKNAQAAFRERGASLSNLSAAQMRNAKIADAASELKGILRMRQEYETLPRLGAQQAAELTARLRNQAVWQYVWLPVDPLVAEKITAPSDDELLAFFNKYRDVNAGDSDVGVGYKLGPRVKLRWLKLDMAAIRKQVKVRAVDVEKRLRESGVVAGSPDEAKKRNEVETKLRDEAAAKILADAELVVKGEVLRTTASLREERIGAMTFRQLPVDWSATRPDLAAIGALAAERVNAKYGISLKPFEVVSAEDGWKDGPALARLPGIGGSMTTGGDRQQSMDQVVLNVRELMDKANPMPSSLPLQLDVPASEPLIDAAGSAYYVLVTAVRGPSGPETMTEVREIVLKDWKMVQAYKTLAEQAPALASAAALEGLSSVASKLTVESKPAEVVTNVYMTRSGGVSPMEKNAAWMFRSQTLVDDIMSRAEKLDATKPLDEQDPALRYFVVQVPQSRGVAIVQIIGWEPLTKERLQREYGRVAASGRRLTQQWALEVMRSGKNDPLKTDQSLEASREPENPFTKEKLIDRMKVKGIRSAGE